MLRQAFCGLKPSSKSNGIAATVFQFINSKPIAKKTGNTRGYNFYKISAIVNMLVGMVGMVAVNLLLRDKNIIPQVFVMISLVGFFLTTIYGLYCFYKMITATEY